MRLLAIALAFCSYGLWAQRAVSLGLQPAPGYYDGPQEVEILGGAAGAVYFSTDGSTPGTNGRVYTGTPIRLDRASVLRVRYIDEDGQEHQLGGSYLIGERPPAADLLTVSVGIDPWRLFDAQDGWFRPGPDSNNYETHAEHVAHVDIIDGRRGPAHSGRLGLRLFGGLSRAFAQKSFSLSGRARYVNKRIDYPLFGPEGEDSFRFLVVRNGGSDWNRSYLRDALSSGLLQDGSWDLDRQAARPVRVYINGRYWGLYHLREKINPRFLADHHREVDKDSLDLLEHRGSAKHGSTAAYDSLRNFVAEHDLRRPENYQQLGERMDIDNFQRLQIAQTYFANHDAGGNIRYWRPHGPGGRFRWILYDVDQGFGLHRQEGWTQNTLELFADAEGPAWPNPPWSTLFQRRLLANAEYRRTFVNRTLDYLHTDFSSEAVLEHIDASVAGIEEEMPRQLARWDGDERQWRYHIEQLRRFARHRPDHLREHFREFFAAGADREVSIGAGRGGYVVLNDNLHVGAGGLEGRYFANYPIRLAAVAEPGYRFVGWEGAPVADTATSLDIDLSGEGGYRRRARFVPHTHALADRIIINEFCPRGAVGGDWLEVYNRSDTTAKLDGWFLADGSGRRYVLPAAHLRPGEYLVVSRDPERFARAYPRIHEVLGPLPFGLNKVRDRIGLYAADGAYVNRLSYELEARSDSTFVHALALPGLNNRQPRHWVTEAGPGTPGSANPAHLQQAIMGRQAWWLRVGVGFSAILLIALVRAMHPRPRKKQPLPLPHAGKRTDLRPSSRSGSPGRRPPRG